MEDNRNQELEQAHAYLNLLPSGQISAVRGLLESMLDPVSLALANAPAEDEEISAAEEVAAGESREWLRHNPGIPFETVLADLGLSRDEVSRASREPA